MAVFAACSDSGGHHHDAPAPLPRKVTLEVEVYDPATDFVWENVDVRIVEAEHEWSQLIVKNSAQDDWFLTDENGVVYWSASNLAKMQLGFIESDAGQALLEPDYQADEAYIQVELRAKGFPTVQADAYISWDEPDAFLSIPYSPLR